MIVVGDRAIAQVVSRLLPTAAAWVRARVWHVGFVVDKVALRQVFFKYFGFSCQSSFHKFSIITITRGRYNRPFSGQHAEWTQFHPPLSELKKKVIVVENSCVLWKYKGKICSIMTDNFIGFLNSFIYLSSSKLVW
jgi:hypothetical protein